ncbi:MAG: response regulator [Bacteroidales bacterium]
MNAIHVMYMLVYLFLCGFSALVRFSAVKRSKEHTQTSRDLNKHQISIDILSDISYKVRTYLSSVLGFFTLLKNEHIDLGKQNNDFVTRLYNENRSLLALFDEHISTTYNMHESQNKLFEDVFKEVLAEHVTNGEIVLDDFVVEVDESVVQNIQEDYDEVRIIFSEIITSIRASKKKLAIPGISVRIVQPLESKTSVTFLFEVFVDGIKKLIHPAPTQIDLFSDSYSNTELLLQENQHKRFAHILLHRTIQILDQQHAKIGLVQPSRTKVGFVFSYSFWKKKPVKTTFSESYKEKHTEQSQEHVSISELHVLLVEDNLMNQNMVAMILQKRVKEVLVANNGKEALQILSTSKVDVVLMDIQMPIMDGYQATERIREIELANEIYTPIIALTANALDNERTLCIEKGMDGYLSKPFGVKELMGVIEEVMYKKTHVPE